MAIADQILGKNDLIDLLSDYNTNHIGYVYAMNFTEASVLTNDAWKEKVAGIPHNSFLVSASFDSNNTTLHDLPRIIGEYGTIWYIKEEVVYV